MVARHALSRAHETTLQSEGDLSRTHRPSPHSHPSPVTRKMQDTTQGAPIRCAIFDVDGILTTAGSTSRRGEESRLDVRTARPEDAAGRRGALGSSRAQASASRAVRRTSASTFVRASKQDPRLESLARSAPRARRSALMGDDWVDCRAQGSCGTRDLGTERRRRRERVLT